MASFQLAQPHSEREPTIVIILKTVRLLLMCICRQLYTTVYAEHLTVTLIWRFGDVD